MSDPEAPSIAPRIATVEVAAPRLVALAVTLLLSLATLAAFAWGVEHWSFTGDDAYISFRYALQLTRGEGLVWQPGEHVEGYTNFLWVLLVAVGLLLGASAEATAMVLGVTSALGVLVLSKWTARRVAGGWTPWVVLPSLWLACSRSFCVWTTSGLETMGYTVLVLGLLVRAWVEGERAERGTWASSLLAALVVLMRPDGVVFVAAVGLVHAVDALRGARSWRSLVAWVLPWAAVLGAHEAFRVAYYGDIVPNTFHVKVNGVWWEQGLRYLQLFAGDYAVAWWGWLAAVPLVLRPGRRVALLALGVAAQLALILWVGGDRFEFRFLVPVLAPFFLLVAEGMALLADRLGRAGPVALAVGAALLTWTVVTTHTQKLGPLRKDVESPAFIASFARKRVEQGQFLHRMVVEGALPADTRLGVGAAGALPYYADLWAQDVFGLTDPVIARQDSLDRRIVAHEKRATPAYLVERDVQFFDAVGHGVDTRLADALEGWRKSADKIRRMDGVGVLHRRCHRYDGAWLIFVNGLSDADHAARFGHLEDCTAQMEAATGKR
ncbi:MAG: hypothetical protein H6733_15665 [Alphaproteobacteria bacterium]|nr:hypothetical protein [Alphaproteobacteria bacterium]